MKAQDLIALLQSVPPETLVLIPGYESGFDELGSAKLSEIRKFDPNAPWYEGQYSEWLEEEYGPWNHPDYNVPDPSCRPLGFKAIFLKSEPRE